MAIQLSEFDVRFQVIIDGAIVARFTRDRDAMAVCQRVQASAYAVDSQTGRTIYANNYRRSCLN